MHWKMTYNLSNETHLYLFNEQVKWLVINKKICKLEEEKHTRTLSQNAARWKYLQMIADILNERGETFTPKGLKIEVPYTKDNLYHNYWQTLREYMYPGKTKQLNTKEFSDLVEMVQMLFAKSFDISIPFPSIENITEEL